MMAGFRFSGACSSPPQHRTKGRRMKTIRQARHCSLPMEQLIRQSLNMPQRGYQFSWLSVINFVLP